MSKNLFYRNEMVNYMKTNALDLIRNELNQFAMDTSDQANIAFRNRCAGIIDMIDHIENVAKEQENDE